jgi:hypothetical protein
MEGGCPHLKVYRQCFVYRSSEVGDGLGGVATFRQQRQSSYAQYYQADSADDTLLCSRRC